MPLPLMPSYDADIISGAAAAAAAATLLIYAIDAHFFGATRRADVTLLRAAV